MASHFLPQSTVQDPYVEDYTAGSVKRDHGSSIRCRRPRPRRCRRQRVLMASSILIMSCNYITIGAPVLSAHHADHRSPEKRLFSLEWEAEYSSARVGCDLGRKGVRWRPCGFGSNALHLLNGWVFALAVERWDDLAVYVEPNQLKEVYCPGHGDANRSGWDCLFSPMPHLCTFHSKTGWEDYMGARNVSKADIKETLQLDWQYLRLHKNSDIDEALAVFGTDHFGALAVMARHLWSNTTPWLRDEVEQRTNTRDFEIFRIAPFVGLHIRRGDKVLEGEAKKVETKEYMKAAAEYLGDAKKATGDRTSVDEIQAIWVAADSPASVKEVRALAPSYFPGVTKDNIVWISGASSTPMATHSYQETFEGFVYVFADLEMLAAAEVFVGTFTSNIGRLVALLREAKHGWPRDSTISLDKAFGVNY